MQIKIGDIVRVQHKPPMPPEHSLEFRVEEIFLDGCQEYARGRSIHTSAWIRWYVDEVDAIEEP